MPVLTERRPTAADLREKAAFVRRRRIELTVKSRRLVQKVVANRQFLDAEREVTKALIPFFVEQGRSMVARLQKMPQKGGRSPETASNGGLSQGVWEQGEAPGTLLQPKPGSLGGVSAKAPSSRSASRLVSQIFDPSEWRAELTNRLLPVLARKMAEAGVAHLMSYGIDVRRKKMEKKGTKTTSAAEWAEENKADWDSLVEAFAAQDLPLGILNEIPEWMQKSIAKRLIESFSQDYWDSISRTTMGDAEQVLRKGLSEGWSIDKMATQLRQYFTEGGFRYARRRSENIARTESGYALNSARKDSVAQLQQELGPSVPMKQAWLSVLGNTTRAEHANLDGVPEDENGMWNLAGYMIPVPGHYSLPPEHRCNCHCSVTIEFGMDEEEAQREIEEYWARREEWEEKGTKYPGQPRDDYGRFGSGGAGGRIGESRATRAKRTHKPATVEKQRKAEAEQARLAGLVGGKETDDNEAFDVLIGKHAVEVKCVIDNDNDKITMHPESRRRKEQFAKNNGMELHTVAIDVRGGKRAYYHRDGVGAFRLSAMERVSAAELRERLG